VCVAAGAALAVPRLAGRGWGFLSLATVAGAVSLPAALWWLRAATPFLLLSLAYALLTIWNHKEHLARIADGVEPRLGQRLPLPGLDGEAVCAFLIHPMTVDYVWLAQRFRWSMPLRRRGLISDGFVRWVVRFVKPMKTYDIHPILTADGRRARVYLIGVPLLPDQIRDEPALAVRRAIEAAHLAASLGATVMGLGAYWSVVGNKGLDVQARSPIAITNGGAYTAGTVKMAVPVVLHRLRARGVDPSAITVAVVGANGVVGFGICRVLAGQVGRLIMVGTDQTRLDRSRGLLAHRHPSAVIETTTRLETLRDAHAIFTATSHPSPVVFPQHVREGSLVFDLGRPPDVDPSVATVLGVEVIPGGVVRVPGVPEVPVYFDYSHYGPGLVPACLAETIVMAIDGSFDRASLGERTKSENVDYFVARGAELGFEVQTTGAARAEQPAGVAG
jgi:predicted amino acid dehydrogenase